jgi:beta-galactosidase GanA
VVEQQYGQRLEALTSSLVGKIQSWILRLRKEEATRDEVCVCVYERAGGKRVWGGGGRV